LAIEGTEMIEGFGKISEVKWLLENMFVEWYMKNKQEKKILNFLPI